MESIRVLVADSDTKSLRETVRLLSERKGLTVVDTALNGYETIAKATACLPQVVLMEMCMETSQAGLLALRELKSLTNTCRVIFYTSVSEPEIICRALAQGADNYLIKPLTGTALQMSLLRTGADKSILPPEVTHILLDDYRRLSGLREHMAELIHITTTLTAAELEILRMLCSGNKPCEIERIRFIEHTTMKSHISHIMKKFDGDSIARIVDNLQAIHFFQMLDS